MVGGGDFVEIMGLVSGGMEISGKFGGVVWWNDFRGGFACGCSRTNFRP